MIGLAHVILHLTFCNAILRAHPEANIAVRVRTSDRIGRPEFDRTFTIDRGDGPEGVVEFDSTFGIHRIEIVTPKYGCSAADYLHFIPDHTRSITEPLSDTPVTPQVPALLSGTAPQSMLYAHPTFVVFDKSAATCGKPIPSTLDATITVENDQDAYYAAFYNDARTRAPDTAVLALRLQTPTHQHHYVRIPVPFPFPALAWPGLVQLDVTDDMMADLATQPIDTLLCPKMWRTSAG